LSFFFFIRNDGKNVAQRNQGKKKNQ